MRPRFRAVLVAVRRNRTRRPTPLRPEFRAPGRVCARPGATSLNGPFLAATPEPPYVAVIFTTEQSDDLDGYEAMSARMLELARSQPGFLGVESVREGGHGITVSYWRDREAVRAWGEHPEHRAAQRLGRERWYRSWRLRVVEVGVERRSASD